MFGVGPSQLIEMVVDDLKKGNIQGLEAVFCPRNHHPPATWIRGETCREQIEEALQRKQLERQSQWSESLAAGSPAYVEAVGKPLGARARGRDVMPAWADCQLREDEAAYGDDLEGEKSRLSLENTRFWNLFSYPKAT